MIHRAINKHGIPEDVGWEGGPASLPPSSGWPINFSSQALGPENLPDSTLTPAAPSLPFPFLLLPCKSVADPLPWELGLAAAAQSSLLAQHHVGFPRRRHNGSVGNFQKLNSFVQVSRKVWVNRLLQGSQGDPTCGSPANLKQAEQTQPIDSWEQKWLRGCKAEELYKRGNWGQRERMTGSKSTAEDGWAGWPQASWPLLVHAISFRPHTYSRIVEKFQVDSSEQQDRDCPELAAILLQMCIWVMGGYS